MASQAPIDANKTAPILRKMQEDQKLNMGNSVEMNLQLYDQYQSLQKNQTFDNRENQGSPLTQGTMGGGKRAGSPLRSTATQQ